MQVVAKTNGGVLISATDDEVMEILRSVNGAAPKELAIGQKIPAIDYAGSITKLKGLKCAYHFTSLSAAAKRFSEEFAELEQAVENAASIE